MRKKGTERGTWNKKDNRTNKGKGHSGTRKGNEGRKKHKLKQHYIYIYIKLRFMLIRKTKGRKEDKAKKENKVRKKSTHYV